MSRSVPSLFSRFTRLAFGSLAPASSSASRGLVDSLASPDASPLPFATNLTLTRGFAVPKRKVSRSRKRMKENHPTKRLRSKKTYSYCESCDEVLGPHQICTGTLSGKCTTHLFKAAATEEKGE